MSWREDIRANDGVVSVLGVVRAWLFSPAIRLLLMYRMASRLERHQLVGRLMARVLWRSVIRQFGCYFSLSATIGPGLRLPHPTGIVIGEGVEISSNVTIYQNVTMGRSSSGDLSYPTVNEGATIYAGAVIIGGVTIGRTAVVGANAVVLTDVPLGTVAAGVPARIIPKKG